MSPLLLALALSAVSQSKLGVVVVGDAGDSTTPAGQLLAACPALVVFPLPSSIAGLDSQLLTFRTACPGSKVVLQVGGSGLSVNAAVAAALWNGTWLPEVLAAAGSTGSLVDGVEGPWEPVGSDADVGAFWSTFVQQVGGRGFLPVIGAFPPGLPSGTGTSTDAFCPALAQVASGARFGVSFHVRAAPLFTTSDAAFAFRQVAIDCSLASAPIFITQVLPASTIGPWTDADATWLIAFARQLAAIDVAGAAAFAIGTTGPFDLSAIAAQLVAELRGTSSGGSGGAGGASSGGGVLAPSAGAATGDFSPPKHGCSTTGPAFGATAWALLLLASRLRRRRRGAHGVKR